MLRCEVRNSSKICVLHSTVVGCGWHSWAVPTHLLACCDVAAGCAVHLAAPRRATRQWCMSRAVASFFARAYEWLLVNMGWPNRPGRTVKASILLSFGNHHRPPRKQRSLRHYTAAKQCEIQRRCGRARSLVDFLGLRHRRGEQQHGALMAVT